MITAKDQLDLFRLIAKNLSKDIECYAFGGTAMMFYGYNDETKDIDLLFEKEEDRQEFVKAIEKLGFEKSDPIRIFIPEKLREKNRPVMYNREEARFDLFVKQIFKTLISPKMQEDLYAVHEFKENKNLVVKVLRKEHIVFLKAITERDKDLEDILTIVKKEKTFDWGYLVKEAAWQHRHGDKWALLDTEKTMKELKKYVFIPEQYFRMLYKGFKNK